MLQVNEQLAPNQRPTRLRLVINTLIGFLLCLSAGGVYAFSLFSQAIRTQLGYSAIGNQYIYNFGVLGYSLAGILTGYILEKRGTRFTLAFGAIFSLFGYAAVALAVRGAFECPAALMWAFSFVASVGQGIAQIAGLVVNTRNFSLKVRGKIVGVTMSTFAISPSFYSVIWNNIFVIDPADYSKNSQFLEAYFWFLFGFIGGVCLLGSFAFRLWDYETMKKQESLMNGEEQGGMEKTAKANHTALVHSKIDELGIFEVLVSVSFLVLMFTYSVFKGVDKTYLGDIGKIGQSLGYDDQVATHVFLSALVSCLVRLISGFAFDMMYPKVPAWLFLEFGLFIILVIDLLILFFMDFMFGSYLSTIGHSSSAIIYALLPAICANRFGRHNMAYTWSIMVSSGTIATFAYGGWNSAIYDSVYNKQTGGEIDGGSKICYGIDCFEVPFIITTATLLFTMIILGLFGRDDQHEKFILERKRKLTIAKTASAIDVNDIKTVQTYKKLEN